MRWLPLTTIVLAGCLVSTRDQWQSPPTENIEKAGEERDFFLRDDTTGETVFDSNAPVLNESGADVCGANLVVRGGEDFDEVGWQITRDEGRVVEQISPGGLGSGDNLYAPDLLDGTVYTFTGVDFRGDGWGGASWELSDLNGTVVAQGESFDGKWKTWGFTWACP